MEKQVFEYVCPECGFGTKSKHNYKNHLFFRKNKCKTLGNIRLTPDQRNNLSIVSKEHLLADDFFTTIVKFEVIDNKHVLRNMRSNEVIEDLNFRNLASGHVLVL